MDLDDIGEQIEKILRSESFADKNQLKRLLDILFKNMDIQAALKPDRVIKDLWPEEAKTKHSADVATEMNRLRKALELYYNAEGINDPIRIYLPKRSLPGPNGVKERRWIVAEPCNAIEVPPVPDAAPVKETPPVTDDRPVPITSQVAPTPPFPLTPSDPQQPSLHPRNRKKFWATIAAGAIGIAVFLSILALSADRRPQSGRLDGPTLTIMNAEGKELWHRNFPDGFWREYYEQGLAPRIWFGDLDGDGRTVVLLLYHPATNPRSHSTTLICYSDWGKEKWRWTPGRALPELGGDPAFYETVGFGVLKATATQPRRIVVSSRHEIYYPHQIAIVDSSGKTISEYWHSGHLDNLALADLDGDGREQIVASGISNGYRQATLIVLDPDRASGASTETARPELQLHGMGAAQERFRLLFPRSDLNKALSTYNEGQVATIDKGRIRLAVRECWLQPSCFIWYEFDRNLQLLKAEPDDQFRSAHKEFYLNTKADHPFSGVEEEEFQKVRCLAGCKTEFVPVVIP